MGDEGEGREGEGVVEVAGRKAGQRGEGEVKVRVRGGLSSQLEMGGREVWREGREAVASPLQLLESHSYTRACVRTTLHSHNVQQGYH